MYWLGAADPAKLEESRKTGVPLPTPHSALFAPRLCAGDHHRRDGDDQRGDELPQIAVALFNKSA
jgi:hypothetical protein